MTQPQTKPIVQLDNLSKSFQEGAKDRLVLDSLNAAFYQGEFAVLLGRSGSGKSTLLNLIAGIEKPLSGQIHVNGTTITA